MVLSEPVLFSGNMLLSDTMLAFGTMLPATVESFYGFCFVSDLSCGSLRLLYDCRTNANFGHKVPGVF